MDNLKLKYIIIITICFILSSCVYIDPRPKPKELAEYKKGLFAKIETNKGDIYLRLFYKKAPITVANFYGLALGKIKNKTFKEGIPYFNNSKFHRVVKDFVIQSGAPQGEMEGSGFVIPNEISPDLKHDTAGILGMANMGPNTNSSQFYITHQATPHLDGGYTVFGKLVFGMNTVLKIEEGDHIKTIKFYKLGRNLKNYIVDDPTFKENLNQAMILVTMREEENKQKIKNDALRISKFVKENINKFNQTESGILYYISKEPFGTKLPFPSSTFKVQYISLLEEGSLLDSSYIKGSPYIFRFGNNIIKGLQEIILKMHEGETRIVVIPPNLAYGKEGKGKLIPSNSKIIYQITLQYFRKYKLK